MEIIPIELKKQEDRLIIVAITAAQFMSSLNNLLDGRER